jgi:hypothetical protein
MELGDPLLQAQGVTPSNPLIENLATAYDPMTAPQTIARRSPSLERSPVRAR